MMKRNREEGTLYSGKINVARGIVAAEVSLAQSRKSFLLNFSPAPTSSSCYVYYLHAHKSLITSPTGLMRGPAPLLGTLAGLAIPTTTRIPHLRAHILLRQSQKQLQGTYVTAPRTGRRFQSGLITFDDVSSKKELESNPGASQETEQLWQSASTSTADDFPLRPAERAWEAKEDEDDWDLQNVDTQTNETHRAAPTANSNLEDILQEGHPERVRFVLRDRFLAEDFIRHADDNAFATAVELLDPDILLSDYKEIYRYTKASLITQPLYRNIRPLEERMNRFAIELDKLIYRRRQAGWKLTLRVCKHLLRCAAVMGDAQMANRVFGSLMPEDGVDPDLGCYNLLMESLCWSKAFNKEEQFSYRKHPRLMKLRSDRFKDLQDKFTGPEKQSSGRKNLRVTVLHKFRELVAHGLTGDEATFTNIMIAMGREGDLAGAKSILKSVWNVDTELLSKFDEEEIEGPTFYELGTPLRPSSRLLATVVHVFGSNNNVGEAFTLVDYLSRNYDLSIPEDVWQQLCEWTFVLSIRRGGARKRREGYLEGKIDTKVFSRLWQVMTDEPHNIVPDIPTLYLRALNLREANLLDASVQNLRDAKTLLELYRSHVIELTTKLLQLIEEAPEPEPQSLIPSASFLDARRTFILASQRLDRDLQLLIIAFRQMARRHDWPGSRRYREWSWRRLPALLKEFEELVPNTLRYRCPGGEVDIQLKKHREAATPLSVWDEAGPGGRTRALQSWRIGLTRNMLDTNDLLTLKRGLEFLREKKIQDEKGVERVKRDRDSGMWVRREEGEDASEVEWVRWDPESGMRAKGGGEL